MAVSTRRGEGFNGTDVNHCATLPGGDHAPRSSLGAQKHRSQVDIQCLCPFFRTGIEQTGDRIDACVIDEDINRAPGGGDLIKEVCHLHGIRQVCDQVKAFLASTLDGLAGFICGTAGTHDHVRPCLGKTQGNTRAEAGTAAGDEGRSFHSCQEAVRGIYFPLGNSILENYESMRSFIIVEDAKDKRDSIQEALRVLKPGGIFVLQDLFVQRALGYTRGIGGDCSAMAWA